MAEKHSFFQFRRITTSGNWIPEIDGLRFIAILSVLLAHTLGLRLNSTVYPIHVQPQFEPFRRILSEGARGVQLFFVISGFILAKPFLKTYLDQPSTARFPLKPYYLRRLTRLEPPYVVSLLIYLAVFVLFMHDPLMADIAPFFRHLFYLHNVFEQGRNLNTATWSLEVEVQFYLIAPLLGLLYRVRSTRIRWSIWIASILLSTWVAVRVDNADHRSYFISLTLVGSLVYFLLGFLIADLLAITQTRWKHRLWDVLALFAWPAIYLLPGDGFDASFSLVILLFLVFMAAMLGSVSKAVLGWKPVALIGGMCYSIYLMHMLLLSTFARVLDSRLNHIQNFLGSYLTSLLLLVPLTIAFSSLFFLLLERPCMDPKWTAKLLRRFRGQSPAPASITPDLASTPPRS